MNKQYLDKQYLAKARLVTQSLLLKPVHGLSFNNYKTETLSSAMWLVTCFGSIEEFDSKAQ